HGQGPDAADAPFRQVRCVMGRTEAAVAKALALAHESLLDDLRNLEDAVGPAARGGLPGLRDRLGDTRAHLVEHFRCEEENGYLDAARQREPRLERAARQLAEEHRGLLHSLDLLLEGAWGAAVLGDMLREEVRQWVRSVRR